MAWDLTNAGKYIASNSDWDGEPALSQLEQQDILLSARAIDVNGISPGGTGYVQTYTHDSMNAAVLQVWRMKLAKVAEYHEGDEKAIADNVRKMFAFWSGQVSGLIVGGAVPVSSGSVSVTNRPVW